MKIALNHGARAVSHYNIDRAIDAAGPGSGDRPTWTVGDETRTRDVLLGKEVLYHELHPRPKVGLNNRSPVRSRRFFLEACGHARFDSEAAAQRKAPWVHNNFRSDTTPTLQYSITPLLLCCAPPSKNFAGLQNVAI